MRNPEEVTLALKDVSDTFTTIVGKPDNNDLLAISNMIISSLVQVVKFDATNTGHELFGVIESDEDYLETTGQTATFVIPPVLTIYESSIPANATAATCRKMEATRAEAINDHDLYDVVNADCCAFILAAVEDVWYCELRDSQTIYSQVTAKRVLAHLCDVCTGREKIDAITILPLMMTMYKEVGSIPEYINELEDALKCAARADLPITDKQVMAITSHAVLDSGDYDTEFKR